MTRKFEFIFVICAAVQSLLLPVSLSVADDSIPLWLAVGPQELVDGLEPLVLHRRECGLEVVVSTKSVEKAIASVTRPPDYLLLVGDFQKDHETKTWFLPTKHNRLYRWRRVQREEFAADASWGDIDDDSIPDFPVGRIPARSREDVDRVVKKIIDYEKQPPSERDLRLLMWGGSPGYGATFDAMSTSLLLAQLQTKAPKWLRPWIISSDPNHALCGWPPDQASTFASQMKQGGVFHILMGHASESHFSSMRFRDKQIWFTADDAKPELVVGGPTPPLVFFTCSSGNFTEDDRCLAESLLFFPGGPVATIGATTESHPLTNYFTGEAMLKSVQQGKYRLGDFWLDAQKRGRAARNFLMEKMLRDVEGKLEAEIDVAKLRRDQTLMYAILGDPATRLRIPKPLDVKIERGLSGSLWKVERPKDASKLIVSMCPTKPQMPASSKLASQKSANEALQSANLQFAFKQVTVQSTDDEWTGTADGDVWLRFVAIGKNDLFVATARVND